MYIKNNNNLRFINPLVSEWELPNPYKEYQKLVDDAKLEGLKAQQKYDWMPITSQALQSLASVLGGINSATGGGSSNSSSSSTSTSATSPYSSTLNLKMPEIKMPTSLLQGAMGMPKDDKKFRARSEVNEALQNYLDAKENYLDSFDRFQDYKNKADSLSKLKQYEDAKFYRRLAYMDYPNNNWSEMQRLRKIAEEEGDLSPLESNYEDFKNTFGHFGRMLLHMGKNVYRGIKNSFALGGSPSNIIPIEAEGGEVYEDPYGNIQEIQGPSHEQGGVNMQVDPLAELYSNRIKIDGLTIADRVKKRAKRNATLEDLLKANPTNSIVKKSWERSQENNKNLKEIEKRLQAEIQKQLNRF